MMNNLVDDKTKGAITIATNNHLMAKPLEKQFNVMLKAVATADRATWTFYKALAKILNEEMYRLDDCETVKQFCEKYSISAPIATRAKNGVNNLSVLAEYGYTEENITVSKSYILSRLEDNQKAFLEYCKQNKKDLSAMGEKGLEELIKQFKAMIDKAINGETETEEAETEEAETEEAETEETESVADDKIKGVIEGGYLNLSIGSKFYSIPMEDLEEYRA